MPASPPRRRFLVLALAGAGLATLAPPRALAAPGIAIGNVTGLYPVEVARVVTPASTADVVRAVRGWPGRIAVGGGRYSMGGQTAVAAGLHLDMRGMHRLLRLDPAARVARVQAGMRWRDLQDHLDPHGLAVLTMQSYANFTVGGAVSVNAHGRYVGNGPVIHSVRALQLVLADGTVVEATRDVHADLFRAAAGGYGAVGVITEVELDLALNTRLERRVDAVALERYPDWFARHVAADRANVMHNADLLPPAFDAPVAVTWRTTGKPVTEPERLVPRGRAYGLNRDVLFAVTELPGGARLRRTLHPLLTAGPAVRWRNREASLDVAELEPLTRRFSTYALQEYFIPVRHFAAFARAMAATIRAHEANVLNVSVRHAPADTVSLLPWAKEEVFSFVVYYKQRTSAGACRRTGEWTRAMIDAALRCEGRYYLPYQLHATRAQFERAYPEAARLRDLKRRVDPAGKFGNTLWDAYL